MNKKPTHLKIVSDNSKTKSNESVREKEQAEAGQLNFFDNTENQNLKPEIKPAYNERELNYLLDIFEKALNQTLKNNAVRNTNDLNRLKKAVDIYNENVVKPLYDRDRNILSLVLVIELLIRMDKIDFKIKKPPYEEDLAVIFLKDFAIKVYFSNPLIIDQFVDYMISNDEYLEMGIDWLMSSAQLIIDLPVSYTIGADEEKLKALHIIHEKILLRFLNEGFRRENDYKIDLLNNFINTFLKNCIRFNVPQEHIDLVFENHITDYCINTQFIEFYIGGMDLKEAYQLIQKIPKKGQLKKFYDKLNTEENDRFIKAIYNFLYHCVCTGLYDYFENVFLTFSKVAKDQDLYDDLLILYRTLAPIKRVKQFLKNVFDKDSKYTKYAQNKIKKVLLD